METQTNTRKSRGEGQLSNEHLTELLELMADADSVELKVTLPEHEHRSAVDALGLDPLDAQIRQVYFFDTPDLRLQQSGLAVRARRIQGRSGDTVVKLRPVAPHDLPEDLRRSAGMNVEVDAMPGHYVCSASMKGKIPNEQVRAAARGERPIKKLFSKEQRSFFADHAPEGLALDDLRILGPTFVLKLVLRPPALGRRLVAEVWLLQDGSRILELSTKSAPAEAFRAAVETRAFLEGHGLDLSDDPHTKTKATLEFFAGKLREDAVTA
jgi:hypothetical protein